jgi:hypothetical protein
MQVSTDLTIGMPLDGVLVGSSTANVGAKELIVREGL